MTLSTWVMHCLIVPGQKSHQLLLPTKQKVDCSKVLLLYDFAAQGGLQAREKFSISLVWEGLGTSPFPETSRMTRQPASFLVCLQNRSCFFVGKSGSLKSPQDARWFVYGCKITDLIGCLGKSSFPKHVPGPWSTFKGFKQFLSKRQSKLPFSST